MLKRFFIAVCGTITGLWISGIVLVLALLTVAGAQFSVKTSSVNDNSILYLDLSGEVIEHNRNTDVLTMLQEGTEQEPVLIDMLSSVRRAANDSKIKAIYINAGGAAIGVAQIEELLAELREFKSAVKRFMHMPIATARAIICWLR